MLVVELDSVKKWRNKHEWRDVQRARCGDFEEVGDHRIIVSICKKMLNAGLSGDVEVMRNGRPVFKQPIPLETWASGKATRGEQPEHLKRAKSGANAA